MSEFKGKVQLARGDLPTLAEAVDLAIAKVCALSGIIEAEVRHANYAELEVSFPSERAWRIWFWWVDLRGAIIFDRSER